MQLSFIDLKRQYRAHKRELDAAMKRVIGGTVFIGGNEIEAFEREFARFCGARHAVALASGTDALFLALRAMGAGKGDEVITVPNTFVSTAMSISNTGATPVFADIDPKTQTLNPEALLRAITPRTKAVIPVHLYGQPAAMGEILRIAKKHHLKVLEDACQAHGARYEKKLAGTLGDASAFSFHPSKNLGAYGDAGAIVTNDSALAETVRALRAYGGKERDHYESVGVNSRLDALQAAILRVKLKHLSRWNEKRREHARQYRALLADTPLMLPNEIPDTAPVYYVFAVRAPRRDALRASLAKKGIPTLVHYPVPIHLQPAYASLGHRVGDFPEAEKAANETLSLPVFPELLATEIENICGQIKNFYAR